MMNTRTVYSDEQHSFGGKVFLEVDQRRNESGEILWWSISQEDLRPDHPHLVTTLRFSPEEWIRFVRSVSALDVGPYGCTDWVARWCQNHGACLCGDSWEDGEYSAECPLHNNDSLHAEDNE